MINYKSDIYSGRRNREDYRYKITGKQGHIGKQERQEHTKDYTRIRKSTYEGWKAGTEVKAQLKAETQTSRTRGTNRGKVSSGHARDKGMKRRTSGEDHCQ